MVDCFVRDDYWSVAGFCQPRRPVLALQWRRGPGELAAAWRWSAVAARIQQDDERGFLRAGEDGMGER